MRHNGVQLSTSRQLASAPVLLSKPLRRESKHRAPIHAALPLDPVALTACAAAASSLLTAAWLRSRGVQSAASQPVAEPEPENPRCQQQQQPAEVGTVQQVWAAAWAAFDKQQQEPSVDSDGSSTSPYQDEAIAAKPMLLLQGIKSSARTQLLALALAAIEQRVEQLPPAAMLLLSGAQWREVATALLASASLAACAAWLGYVPAELEEAARLAIGQLNPATLEAVGLGCPGLVGGLSSSSSSSSSSGSSSRGGQRGVKGSGSSDASRSTRIESFYWVGLDERLALYCSVLRLVRSHSIEAQQQQQPAGGGQQQWGQEQQQQQQQFEGEAAQQGRSWLSQHPAASSASSSTAGQESPGQPASLPAAPGALASTPAGIASSSGSGSAVALRQAAKQSLQESSAALELRGWRATSAGVKSSSQLLALAPAVLHDMAVMVAEAVAAGYLSDVDAGLDPAAALQSAAVLQAGGSTPGSSNLGSGGIASSSGTRVDPLGSTGSATQRPGGSGSAMAPAGALASQDVEMASGSGGREDGGVLVPLEASYWPTFLHRQLSSTRQLQRFANQVLLQRWMSHQYHTVAAMYEDRMDLFGLGPAASLQVRRVPLRRVAELNKLRGGRFVMSLLLELADLAAPALRSLWRQMSAFVSWLLVRLIGQSLGLIYKGIRLSLSPNQQRQAQQRQAQQRRKGAGASSKQRQEEEVPEMPSMPSWEGLL